MKKFIGILILKFRGWQIDYPSNYKSSKCVMIAAPHTSIWDFIYSFAIFWERDIKIKFLFDANDKNKLILFLIKKIGGININEIEGSVVDYSVELLNKSDKIILIVPAEGTLKRVGKWRTGFYHIARKANVPVALGYLDYYDRTGGIGDLFRVSGNINNDFKKIQNFYKNFTAKVPENYNSIIY